MNDEVARVAEIFGSEDHARPVFRAEDVPPSYEAVTDEWLTDVLCTQVRDARVIGHSFDKRDDGSSNRRRIFLEYNDAGKAAGFPPSATSA